MSQTIWKYEVPLADDFALTMPGFIKVVSIGPDPHGIRSLWALVDTDRPYDEVDFAIRGTGQPLPMDRRFAPVGSFTEGPFVWHLLIVGNGA